MADIHLFGGEKGGVGKSFVCRSAIDYHLDHEIDCAPFDSDRTNPDVLKIYRSKAGARGAIFSESPRHVDSANAIITTALDNDRRVLVNLSGNSLTPLLGWMNGSKFVDLAEQEGSTFYYWFVCSGGFDSLRMFGESMEAFDDRVQHIFVKNHGISEDWESYDKDEPLQKLIKRRRVAVVDFPPLVGNYHRDQVRKLGLTFLEGKQREEFGLLGRQRVNSFLTEAHEQFEALGVFDVAGK